jgi:hypothetical protein
MIRPRLAALWLLALALWGARPVPPPLPAWSAQWGYGPSGLGAVLLVIIIVLLLTGRL